MRSCAACIFMKRLRGANEIRWGCYHLLIAYRPLPGEDQLIRASEIDVVAHLRSGHTTREHIECAARIGPDAGARQWWEERPQDWGEAWGEFGAKLHKSGLT